MNTKNVAPSVPFVDFSALSTPPKPSKKMNNRLIIFLIILVLPIIVSYYFLTKNFSLMNKKNQTDNIKILSEPTITASPFKKEIIGFLPSWQVAKEVKVYPEKLTQIIYFGLGINEKGEIIKYDEVFQPVLEWHYFNSDYFKKIRSEALKSKTKILLSIKFFDNKNSDILISDENKTDIFIKQLLSLIIDYKLDGINVDFEYFTDSNFPTAKYLNKFLTKLSGELKKSNPKLILSFDVNATVILIDKAYDMVKIGEVVDQVIVMGYDYHRTNSTTTGPVSPLFGNINQHNINQSIRSLFGRVPREKIILGIPFYGYEWQTINEKYQSPVVENSGALATFDRINELLISRHDIEINWDEETKTPWLSYEQSGAIKQIYYENEQSLSEKITYVNNNNLNGIAIWALGYEGNNSQLWSVINNL